MSAHCRHPERVSAKDPVIFFILNIMNKMTCPIVKVLTICVFVLAALFFQGCPYIAHDSSDAPEQVTAEDVKGCYYSEQVKEDTYIDKKLPNVDGGYSAMGREKRYDRILCKEICFEGDSATVVVRGFALTYDTTGQIVEDTIPYTLRGATISYSDSGEIHTIWDSKETVYKETFPVSFLEPANDGVFHKNIMTYFPVSMNTNKPTYHSGNFIMFGASKLSEGVFSRDGAFRKISVTYYSSEEIFSTKGWDVCKGF